MTTAEDTDLEALPKQDPRPAPPPGLLATLERAARLHGFELPKSASRFPERPVPPPDDVEEAKRVAARARGMDGRTRALESIPPEFRWCRLDAVELAERSDPRAVARAKASPRVIVTTITGQARQGKTNLATALFVDHLEVARPPTGLWVDAAELITEAVRETKLGNEPPLLERARRVSVLLLDELGGELEGDASRTLVEQLITKRHREHKPTLVTTGLPRDVFERRYSYSVFGRLTEPDRALVLVVERRGG
ncbi:MAG: ATP-binding protein [Polyangiaceae bacterium]|nr:ATP-binding protein [Polyangiaceae bacterium]